MLPPSDPEWTNVSQPGVSRPPGGPPDDVYPIGTDRTITPRRDRPLRPQDGESRVQQRIEGAFNPRVLGSIPRRPTANTGSDLGVRPM